MSAFPDNSSIQDIASELHTTPAFIVKDWYVSEVITAVSCFKSDQFLPIFCGGTSLMKGYKIIHRFSEDVDFRILNKSTFPCSRVERRDYRKTLLTHLSKIENIRLLEDTLVSRNSSRFFTLMIQYPKERHRNISLRPEIKLECTFIEETLDGYHNKDIEPIVNGFTKESDSISVPCLSLLETCADKISALTWRVLNRVRSREGDDVTIIRHLYDLHALFITDIDKEQLNMKVRQIFNRDRKRGGILQCFDDAFSNLISILKSDEQYRIEYQYYVLNMCYGQNDPPTYNQVLNSLLRFQG